ncbi:cytochrome c biogenesis protein ResB [Pigmentiphaga sp. NML030171]|uniref:cytochrome c biogenesis protein ResB n=1 Tax=Pigmentiphaga sp. NML030171 TaxID=2008676 RepID=UPI0015954970|nr:cytochrome c biogenesis protein ResB [Pigmentiphaga sp. NML030171]
MMTIATSSASRPASRGLGADLLELLASMRFAVSLLVFICLASIVGTVLVQNQPSNNYVNQFGQFWFEVFDTFSLYHVYNAWWFLLIMGFLVVSTSLCIIRTAPKMVRDMRSFREHVRENSLRSFHHRAEFASPEAPSRVAGSLAELLKRQGYAVRTRAEGPATLLAAKRGSGNRLGYIFAHTAIVIVCIGGLLDSELPIRLQIWLAGKKPLFENMAIADVPASGRLGLGNPSFRSSVLVPEGGKARNGIVMVDDGALVQPLPFTLELKKFIVEYYSTGMPRLFASEVEVTDNETGEHFPATIKVNEPLRYKGVTVYQSSFDDGGSSLELTGYALRGDQPYTFPVSGKVGGTAQLVADGAPASDALKDLTVEFSGFRPINVENFANGRVGAAEPKALREHVAAVSGSAARVGQNEDFRNVGPSVQYKLRDASGQAHEFHNYMLPVDVDGVKVFLSGVRTNPDEDFRYVRMPADADNSLKEFMGLRAILQDPQARALAARRFAHANRLASGGAADGELTAQLQASAERALDTFADGGLQSIARFLETNVSSGEQQRAADVVVKLLGGAMAELRAVERERAGLPALPTSGPEAAAAVAWTQAAVGAMSDLFLYPAPVILGLKDFHHVQASVFQLSRTPGKNAVYLGCVLLILGVFSMFYIRERRVWLWVKPGQDGQGAQTLMAMTSQRRTLDFNQEFERLKADIAALSPQQKG